ncbi:MAG: hypothetical protein VX642_02895 [Bdellovibrionota bacterium]|nr:hypothetical protein [Bdellovibrionota bacterium]
MKRIWTLFLVIAGISFYSAQSFAGLYLEPKMDYNALSMDASGITVDGLKGTTIGARIGYDLAVFVLALDYSMGSLDAEIGGATTSADSTRLGATFIFAPPVIPFNLLAGYYTAKLDTDSTDYSGDGTKFGVMFTMLPIVNINLEYFNTAYDVNSLRDKGLSIGLSADFSL